MMNGHRGYMILLIFLIFASGCQPKGTPTLATSEETITSDVRSSATMVPDKTDETGFYPSIPFHKIKADRIDEIWWTQDSLTLYIKQRSFEVLSYSLLEKTAVRADYVVLPPGKPYPDMLQQLPSGAHSVGTSPSRNKVLYVIPVAPTPEQPAYPMYNQEVPAQLWLWQDGQSQQVGEITDCITGSFGWSANEKIVLIYSQPRDCKNAYVTLLNLNTFRVTPLFPEMGWFEVSCCDPSPDGSRLTYIIDKELYFLDPISLETTKLNAPPLSYLTSQWIDDQRMLVLYPDILGEPITVGILNIETYSVEKFFSESDTFLEGEYFFLPTVSPNGQWLAFVSGEFFEFSSTVWIFRLPDS